MYMGTNEFLPKTSKITELENKIHGVNQEFYTLLESVLHISKADLESLGIDAIVKIISETESRARETVLSVGKKQEQDTNDEARKGPKKTKKIVAEVREDPKIVMSRLVNQPALEFLDWKYTNNQEMDILCRAVNLLRTRIRYAINFPNGYQSDGTSEYKEGGIHDPNVIAAEKAQKGWAKPPKFRS